MPRFTTFFFLHFPQYDGFFAIRIMFSDQLRMCVCVCFEPIYNWAQMNKNNIWHPPHRDNKQKAVDSSLSAGWQTLTFHRIRSRINRIVCVFSTVSKIHVQLKLCRAKKRLRGKKKPNDCAVVVLFSSSSRFKPLLVYITVACGNYSMSVYQFVYVLLKKEWITRTTYITSSVAECVQSDT